MKRSLKNLKVLLNEINLWAYKMLGKKNNFHFFQPLSSFDFFIKFNVWRKKPFDNSYVKIAFENRLIWNKKNWGRFHKIFKNSDLTILRKNKELPNIGYNMVTYKLKNDTYVNTYMPCQITYLIKFWPLFINTT